MNGSDASDRVLAFVQTPVGRLMSATLRHYFRASLEGACNLPKSGPALIVGNHAPYGIDSFVLTALITRCARRHIRFVGERALWKLHVARAFFELVGALPAGYEAILAALEAGEWVGIYPGGIDESLKRRHERHRLCWGSRAGFARVALRARVPVIPIAGLGIDDTYHVLLRERWLGRRLFGSSRYDIALGVGALGSPLPRRAPHRFVVCPAITPRGDPDCPADVWRLRCRVYDALDAVLANVRTASPGAHVTANVRVQ